MVLEMEVAAFCAAESTDEKKPPDCWDVSVPRDSLRSSSAGVTGRLMIWESLLVARAVLARRRRAASKPPLSGVEDLRLRLATIKEALSGSEERSVGVGGVTKVCGP